MHVVRLVAVALVLTAACSPSRDERAAPPPPPVVVQVQAPPAAPAAPAATSPRADLIRQRYSKYEYRIPMRDGARLYTAVYLPAGADAAHRYPILMTRTPYGCDPYGADRYPARLGQTAAFEEKGYIFVCQDVRGQNASEGEFLEVTPHGNPINESTDTYDTIEFLLAHVPHHNGKVGQWGISYPGFYTSAGAIGGHPALVAISPQAPVSDWWHGDDFHRNGAFALQIGFWFFEGFGRPRPQPTEDEHSRSFPWPTVDAYDFFLARPTIADLAMPADNRVWKDFVAHPDYDAYWQARNILPNLKNIRAAVLVVGGWFDTENLYGALETYRHIERQNPRAKNQLMMGPWFHGGWMRSRGDALGDTSFGFTTSDTFDAAILAFFEHHLRGGPAPALPEARVFETGTNRWRDFAAWPPPGTRAQPLFLREGGLLAAEAAPADGADEYVSDPAKPVPFTATPSVSWGRVKGYMAEDQRFASTRPDVLVYQTPPLTEDLTVAGPIEVELHVSTTGSDADFIVKVIDVQPPVPRDVAPDDVGTADPGTAGMHLLVRGEPFRGRYRQSDTTPTPFTPGEVTTIKFTLDDVFHTFQRGHRLMVHVQSTWFPFIDRNPQTFVPNIFEARREDYVKQTHRVHRGPSTPSQLTLRVLPSPDQP